MSKFKAGNSKFSRFMNGKGFYIALALCLVAIGSAAYIAVNNSANLFSGPTKSGSSVSEFSPTQSEINWNDNSAEQTGQTVSGVQASSPSSAASSSTSSSKVASKSSSSKSAAPTFYIMPVQGNIITPFSIDKLIYDKTMDDYRTHNGIDIEADEGTPVKACADGTVSDVYTDDLLGQVVVIDHGAGIKSIYANLTSAVSVKKGQTIEAGTVIGSVGHSAQCEISIAKHLHFAMTKNGVYVDPLATMGKK